MNNFIVSCENDQELSDLTKVACRLSEKNFNACFFDISPMLGVKSSSTLDRGCYYSVFKSFGLKGKKFKELSALSKLIVSLANAFVLVFLYYRNRAGFVLIGTPLLVYRLARIITFGNLKTVSVIRGLVAHSEEATSISSKVFMRLGRLGQARFFRSIFSDYYSHLVFCTGRITRDFLLTRGVPEKNLRVLGSIYCDSLGGGEARSMPSARKLVVFVSSAFAFHGYEDAQKAQTELLRRAQKLSRDVGVSFLVRKHPRESVDIYSSEPDLLGCVDISNCDPLVGYPVDTLFISTTSTLIFELAYAGRKACIIADDFFLNRFLPWYKAVGISPIIQWDSLLNDYSRWGASNSIQDLSGVICIENKGFVLDACIEEICSFLGKENV